MLVQEPVPHHPEAFLGMALGRQGIQFMENFQAWKIFRDSWSGPQSLLFLGFLQPGEFLQDPTIRREVRAPRR